eukprot:SAG31_NODE_3875_length_3793_cov_1.875203_1_plen_20_part_10
MASFDPTLHDLVAIGVITMV